MVRGHFSNRKATQSRGRYLAALLLASVVCFPALTSTDLQAESPFPCSSKGAGDVQSCAALSLDTTKLASIRGGHRGVASVNQPHSVESGVTLWDELRAPRPPKVSSQVSSQRSAGSVLRVNVQH